MLHCGQQRLEADDWQSLSVRCCQITIMALLDRPPRSRGVHRPPRVRNDVANVLNPRREHDEPFKAEAKTGVGHRPVPPQVEIVLVSSEVHAALLDLLQENLHPAERNG